MKKFFYFILLAFLASCASKQNAIFTITVTNDQAFDRIEEFVEVPISSIAKQV